MPTLGLIVVVGLIGLVVAALAVAVAIVLLRRRGRVDEVDPEQPRTVADLVRLRAGAAAAAPSGSAAAVPDPADPVSEDVPRIGPEAVSADPPVADPHPTAGSGQACNDDEAQVVPAGDVLADGPAERVPDDAAAAAEAGRHRIDEAPAVARLGAAHGSDDTPWGRAARMAGDDSGWIPVELGAPPVVVEPPTAPVMRLVRSEPPVAAVVEVEPPARAGSAVSQIRRSATDTLADQAAADLALLRTFGFADPCQRPTGAPVVALVGTGAPPAPVDGSGPAQVVRFRVVARDGAGVPGAGVALLDGRGSESGTGIAGADGRGELTAPGPGTYVVVSTAPDHQPGAVAITVSDGPVEVEVLLARSATVFGTVFGEDGPIAGARLTLVQDGEVVDAADSLADGGYRITDLAAGEYGMSVVAAECEPVVILLDVPDGSDLEHDVDLDPAGLPPAARDNSDRDNSDRADSDRADSDRADSDRADSDRADSDRADDLAIGHR